MKIPLPQSLKAKLLSCIAILSGLSIADSVFILSRQSAVAEAGLVMQGALSKTIAAKDLEIAIIQVQQYLQDVGSTRLEDGLDGGFHQAAEAAKAFDQAFQELMKAFREGGDQSAIDALNKIRASFDAYYNLGVKMAHAYVDGGTGAGNKMMKSFDAQAS